MSRSDETEDEAVRRVLSEATAKDDASYENQPLLSGGGGGGDFSSPAKPSKRGFFADHDDGPAENEESSEPIVYKWPLLVLVLGGMLMMVYYLLAIGSGGPTMDDVRLPRIVLPTHYHLRFSLDNDEWTFQGTVSVCPQLLFALN